MRTLLKCHNYSYFKTLYRKCLNHTKEINAFNAFYSKYITAITFLYAFIISSILIVLQYENNSTFVILLSWTIFAIYHISCIFSFTYAGSKTISLNKKMFLKLRSFQMALCDRRRTPFRRDIIHLGLVNEYNVLLIGNSFRLTTSSLLNNKLFVFQMIGFVSGIYMKVFDRK